AGGDGGRREPERGGAPHRAGRAALPRSGRGGIGGKGQAQLARRRLRGGDRRGVSARGIEGGVPRRGPALRRGLLRGGGRYGGPGFQDAAAGGGAAAPPAAAGLSRRGGARSRPREDLRGGGAGGGGRLPQRGPVEEVGRAARRQGGAGGDR